MGAIHSDVIEGVNSFSGFFVYPDGCDFGCIVEPFGPGETNYVFPDGLAGLVAGGSTSLGVESSVNIVDDDVLGQEDLDVAAFLGLSVTVGQRVDVWAVASETAGEFTPCFVDWNVEFIYSTSSPFSDTDYVATPPPTPDLILFAINHDDGNVFFAIGNVSSVPEPAFAAALAAGVLGSPGYTALGQGHCREHDSRARARSRARAGIGWPLAITSLPQGCPTHGDSAFRRKSTVAGFTDASVHERLNAPACDA